LSILSYNIYQGLSNQYIVAYTFTLLRDYIYISMLYSLVISLPIKKQNDQKVFASR